MKHVQISKETKDLLKAHADPTKEFNDTSFLYDGQWHIEVDDQTYQRLEARRAPGESFDTVIRQSLIAGRTKQ